MNKLLSFFVVASLVLFTSCQKDTTHVDEKAGNIPGMGNTPGELEVSEYNLPEGFDLVGEITGMFESEGVVAQQFTSLKTTNTSNNRFYGCGGKYIQLKLTIKNNIDRRRTCFFPPGLIFRVNNNKFQHAINLCWTWISFSPMQERTFVLYLFCINLGRRESLVDAVYSIEGITKSPNMKWLTDKCNRKRLNYECFPHHYSRASLKSGDTFDEVVGQMQEIVWALTNGNGLTEEQKSYIDELPLLDSDQLPDGIEDIDNFDPPYYWDEYIPEYVIE